MKSKIGQGGQIIVKDSKFQEGLYPGVPIRYPREEKGRFETLERESYLDKVLGKDVVDLPDETMDCCLGTTDPNHAH